MTHCKKDKYSQSGKLKVELEGQDLYFTERNYVAFFVGKKVKRGGVVLIC